MLFGIKCIAAFYYPVLIHKLRQNPKCCSGWQLSRFLDLIICSKISNADFVYGLNWSHTARWLKSLSWFSSDANQSQGGDTKRKSHWPPEAECTSGHRWWRMFSAARGSTLTALSFRLTTLLQLTSFCF